MARAKKTTTTETTGFTPEELRYVEKYPTHKFVPGTLKGLGEHEFGKKWVITIRCATCDAERQLATSDFFPFFYCSPHPRAARAKAMKAKRAAKRLAKKATADATPTQPPHDTPTAENATAG